MHKSLSQPILLWILFSSLFLAICIHFIYAYFIGHPIIAVDTFTFLLQANHIFSPDYDLEYTFYPQGYPIFLRLFLELDNGLRWVPYVQHLLVILSGLAVLKAINLLLNRSSIWGIISAILFWFYPRSISYSQILSADILFQITVCFQFMFSAGFIAYAFRQGQRRYIWMNLIFLAITSSILILIKPVGIVFLILFGIGIIIYSVKSDLYKWFSIRKLFSQLKNVRWQWFAIYLLISFGIISGMLLYNYFTIHQAILQSQGSKQLFAVTYEWQNEDTLPPELYARLQPSIEKYREMNNDDTNFVFREPFTMIRQYCREKDGLERQNTCIEEILSPAINIAIKQNLASFIARAIRMMIKQYFLHFSYSFSKRLVHEDSFLDYLKSRDQQVLTEIGKKKNFGWNPYFHLSSELESTISTVLQAYTYLFGLILIVISVLSFIGIAWWFIRVKQDYFLSYTGFLLWLLPLAVCLSIGIGNRAVDRYTMWFVPILIIHSCLIFDQILYWIRCRKAEPTSN